MRPRGVTGDARVGKALMGRVMTLIVIISQACVACGTYGVSSLHVNIRHLPRPEMVVVTECVAVMENLVSLKMAQLLDDAV